ncbi:site-specific integrase [Actinobaculum sp. 352]|nr:site-specific integrase [Actinobaculum sp. 352]
MAHIHTHIRSDGTPVFRVRFRLRPNSNPVNESFESIEDAYQFADLVDRVGGADARRIREVTTTTPQIITLEAALDDYITHIESHAAHGTGWEYRRVAERYWLPRLGFFPIQALTRRHVEEWVAWQRHQTSRNGKPYATKTIRNAHGLLSSVLDWQVQQGVIPANVARGVKIADDQPRREMVFLTPDQFTRMLTHLLEQLHPLIVLLYTTGMRWGEATALIKADFSLEAQPPTVRISRAWKRGDGGRRYIGAPKSKAAYRTISLPESTVRIMTPLLDGLADGDRVFPPASGTGPLRAEHLTHRYLHPACEAAGLAVRPRLHDLRHSHASTLIAAGVPLPVIQRRLGHESITTTVDTYGHLSQDAWAGAAEAMEAAIAPAVPLIE